jgi:hypothetical protein
MMTKELAEASKLFDCQISLGAQTLSCHADIDGLYLKLSKTLQEPAHPLLWTFQRVASTLVASLGIVHDKAAAVLIGPLGGFPVDKLL